MAGSAGRPRLRADQEPCVPGFARQGPGVLEAESMGSKTGTLRANPEVPGERRGVAKASAADYQTASTFPISTEHFFVFLFSQKGRAAVPGFAGAENPMDYVAGEMVAWLAGVCRCAVRQREPASARFCGANRATAPSVAPRDGVCPNLLTDPFCPPFNGKAVKRGVSRRPNAASASEASKKQQQPATPFPTKTHSMRRLHNDGTTIPQTASHTPGAIQQSVRRARMG